MLVLVGWTEVGLDNCSSAGDSLAVAGPLLADESHTDSTDKMRRKWGNPPSLKESYRFDDFESGKQNIPLVNMSPSVQQLKLGWNWIVQQDTDVKHASKSQGPDLYTTERLQLILERAALKWCKEEWGEIMPPQQQKKIPIGVFNISQMPFALFLLNNFVNGAKKSYILLFIWCWIWLLLSTFLMIKNGILSFAHDMGKSKESPVNKLYLFKNLQVKQSRSNLPDSTVV